MAERQMPQLLMRLPDLSKLPEIELPDGFSIHTEDEIGPRAWEWIIEGAFGKFIPYSSMTGDAEYAPDRVYFVKQYSQDVATASAFHREPFPGEGYLHMVGAHPGSAGTGAGYLAVLAVLRRFREDGVKSVVLHTDDFRLPAIHTYLKLGFEPVMADESHEERWVKIYEALAAYKKADRAPIPLWKGTVAPYTQDCGDKTQPSIKPFPAEGSRGAVVVCPGGGYCMKASHEGDPIALALNAAGISAFVLDYRVNPCPFEAPLADAQRAIRVVRSMGYEQVAILGFSAGGHLTCSAATLYTPGDPTADDPIERLSSRPDAFVPCYAVVSFAAFRHQGSLASLLRDRANDYDLIRRFSAELHVTCDTPPAFIWHTAADQAVPVEQSLTLAQALAHAGIPFELHVFQDGAHGLGLAGGRPAGAWMGMCNRWLLGRGFGAKNA